MRNKRNKRNKKGGDIRDEGAGALDKRMEAEVLKNFREHLQKGVLRPTFAATDPNICVNFCTDYCTKYNNDKCPHECLESCKSNEGNRENNNVFLDQQRYHIDDIKEKLKSFNEDPKLNKDPKLLFTEDEKKIIKEVKDQFELRKEGRGGGDKGGNEWPASLVIFIDEVNKCLDQSYFFKITDERKKQGKIRCLERARNKEKELSNPQGGAKRKQKTRRKGRGRGGRRTRRKGRGKSCKKRTRRRRVKSKKSS
jgi:hypothetical protein